VLNRLIKAIFPLSVPYRLEFHKGAAIQEKAETIERLAPETVESSEINSVLMPVFPDLYLRKGKPLIQSSASLKVKSLTCSLIQFDH